ncbi:Circadian clock protein KaiB [Sporomusa ovata DSM 2662]|uniref:circadian clock KaiB family protein n=1 Tax=Sporomusa ovata TaxID=2378 RepID=UPI000388386E|nr:circadian clock KaiB family protein [Sporomusa ovata]EQB28601.1 KaiB-like protein 1 [Sporomusa ovata DSM 2662]
MDYVSSADNFELSAVREKFQPCLLQLYIAGCSLHSQRAISNLRTLFQDHPEIKCRLDIIDILQQPELAKESQIIAVPTLIKREPVPIRLFIGNMSDIEVIIAKLTS